MHLAQQRVRLIRAGYVYVADVGNHRIDVFRLDGTFVTQWGGQGAAPGQFFRPTCVTLGQDGSIYVADKDNHRVQKFGSIATAARRSTWGALKARFR